MFEAPGESDSQCTLVDESAIDETLNSDDESPMWNDMFDDFVQQDFASLNAANDVTYSAIADLTGPSYFIPRSCYEYHPNVFTRFNSTIIAYVEQDNQYSKNFLSYLEKLYDWQSDNLAGFEV